MRKLGKKAIAAALLIGPEPTLVRYAFDPNDYLGYLCEIGVIEEVEHRCNFTVWKRGAKWKEAGLPT